MLGLHFLRSVLRAAAHVFAGGLGASIVRGSAHRKDIEIRTHFGRPARVPMWIAGISICLLAASGIVAIVRSIPASYANIPNDGAPSNGAASNRVEGALSDSPQADLAVAKTAINRGRRARCPECGVVESMRQIEVKFAGDRFVGASGSAFAAGATTAKNYEITVRFRDGSATVFNEASPRTWRLGSRVIVINRSPRTSD